MLVLYFPFSSFAFGSIHQGHERFSNESRGRQEIFIVFGCFYLISLSAIFADSRMEVLRDKPFLYNRDLCKKETRHCSFGDLLRKINITLVLPAISNFAFTFAVVDVKPDAVSFTGTNPSLVNNSSSLVQALRAMKKPLSFVCARTLYGVSVREIPTSEIGAPFFD